MKKIAISLITAFTLVSCNSKTSFTSNDYGAFLGRTNNNIKSFINYKYVALEIDEFSKSNIEKLTKNGTNCLAYLNVGSLENYRDYYEEFKDLTFKDYHNWPDERWIDVTNKSWQNLVVSLAKKYKNKGAFGVYIDNVDVYSIAKEEGLNYQDFANSLKSVMNRVNKLGLKVMVNGGAEYFDDSNDNKDNVFNYVWGYHQEEVFSLITNYEHDIFAKQDKENQNYYKKIAQMMKNKNKEVFLLEYTTDLSLKNDIKKYCEEKQYHYYLSSKVNLE